MEIENFYQKASTGYRRKLWENHARGIVHLKICLVSHNFLTIAIPIFSLAILLFSVSLSRMKRSSSLMFFSLDRKIHIPDLKICWTRNNAVFGQFSRSVLKILNSRRRNRLYIIMSWKRVMACMKKFVEH